ncbi:DUF7033 domain-containing protein [Rasiella sp. SM2506]|uniref:DUF7033 domain-containing protein n=1 Tax=Rasiella sp. SM2506 TaxID=3423914 RepID=UPI003D7B0012
MLLVYSQKLTTRLSYSFKHIFLRILGIDVRFTSVLEEFIAYEDPKMSYGKHPLGNEFFVQEHGLLAENGIESIEILLKEWDDIPAFFPTIEKSAIPFDIFAASFYLLSRYEEYLPHVKDTKGRYPAAESLAFQNNFLELPIVDMWAYKLKVVLQQSFENIKFPHKQLMLHNVISVQRPFAYNQKGFFRSFLCYFQDFTKGRFKNNFYRTQVLLGIRKDPFDTFTWIVNIAKRSTSKMTAFFLLGENEEYQDSLNTHRKAFQLLVKYVADYKEVGLLYSASSITKFATLEEEVKRMESTINRNVVSAKQSNYFVNLPENYRNLIELEIEKDFTMAYYDTPGFRAGTCTPFLFYDLDFEIKTPLILHPIALASTAMQHEKAEKIEAKIQNLMQKVAQVNGVFSVVLSNENFTSEEENRVWRKLFSETLQNYE